MACIAYSFFLGSSFVCVFYLLKDRVRTETMAGCAALVCVLFLAIAAGKSFFMTGKVEFFKVVKLAGPDGVMKDVIMDFKGPDGKPMQQYVTLPYAGALFGGLIALYLAAAGALLTRVVRSGIGYAVLAAALVVHALLIADVLAAPSFISEMAVKSNPYRLAAIIMTLGIGAFFASLYVLKDNIIQRLPTLNVLDRWGYEAILLGVPFMTLNLISGAVWAYYAWGRYWGWDPKETWALITWFIYVIYLHMRILGGWKGRKTALISIFGFFVVIFTYLGVNLVISGLHSYATA
jgi:cytochrome c-type biogenesis protein CcsB